MHFVKSYLPIYQKRKNIKLNIYLLSVSQSIKLRVYCLLVLSCICNKPSRITKTVPKNFLSVDYELLQIILQKRNL